jgi:hypothetical protein
MVAGILRGEVVTASSLARATGVPRQTIGAHLEDMRRCFARFNRAPTAAGTGG